MEDIKHFISSKIHSGLYKKVCNKTDYSFLLDFENKYWGTTVWWNVSNGVFGQINRQLRLKFNK